MSMVTPATADPVRRELEARMLQQATVYGTDPATGEYILVLLGPFKCSTRFMGAASAGTGGQLGTYQVDFVRISYPASVTLPAGYWQIEVDGVRYVPRPTMSAATRAGNTPVSRYIDVDALVPG